MNTTKWRTVLTAVLATGIGTFARADDRAVSLDIEVVADPAIPSRTVADARAVVDRVYRSIGVEIAWADRNRAIPEAELSASVVWRRISIKSTAHKQFPAAFGNAEVLGVSPRGQGVPGRAAYVFYDAVRTKARRFGVPIAALLGYAMAHELGHLLLPRESHGEAGVMRGQWRESDLRMMRDETLSFDGSDTSQIRTALGLAPGGRSR